MLVVSTSTAASSYRSRARRARWRALAGVAALALFAGCATGAQGEDDDDDDGAAGHGGTSSGTTGTTTSTSGSGASGGTGSGDARAPLVGEVIFTEVMPDPDQLSDADAEWLELKNVSTAALELGGCRLTDADPSGDAVTIGGSVRLEPAAIAIFAKSDSPALNGNLPAVALAFGNDFSLGNNGDEAILECTGQIVDQVAYGSDWPYDTGASMQLRADRQTSVDNDAAANWCTATAIYNAGNLGTPGTDAGQCL